MKIVSLSLRTLGIACNIIATSLLVRYLSVSDYGFYVSITGIIVFIIQISELGLSQNLLRELTLEKETKYQISTAALTLAILSSFVISVATILCFKTSLGISFPLSLLIVSVSVISSFKLFATYLVIEQRYLLLHALPLLNALVWLCLVILGKSFEYQGFLFVSLYCLAAIFNILVIFVLSKRYFQLKHFSRSQFQSIVKMSSTALLSSILINLYFRLDTALIGSLQSLQAAAIYGATYKFLEVGQIFYQVYFTGFIPDLVSRTDKNRSHFFIFTLKRLALISIGILVLGNLLGPFILVKLFGEKYIEGAILIPWFSVSLIAIGLNYMAVGNLIAFSKLVKLIPYQFIAVVLYFMTNFIMIPRYGFISTAIITSLTESFITLAALRISFKLLNLPHKYFVYSVLFLFSAFILTIIFVITPVWYL